MREKRLVVSFMGRVQGVGFRYTVCSLAGQYPVTGFVRNEWDGSVYMEVEGKEADVEDFLRLIHRSRLGSCISNTDAHWSESTGRHRGFRISY